MTSASEVAVEVDRGVARVVLNRPDRLNALSTAVFDQLIQVFAELDRSQDVRVVCLAAAGDRAFSVGADLKELKDRDGSAVPGPLPRSPCLPCLCPSTVRALARICGTGRSPVAPGSAVLVRVAGARGEAASGPLRF